MTSEQAGYVLDPLNQEDLKLSDPDLGLRLLGLYVVAVAVENNLVDSLGDPEFTQAVIDQIPLAEAEYAKNSTVEKALHKVAAEDFETAGRLIREHLTDGAYAIAIINAAVSERAKSIKGPAAGGMARAEQRRAEAAERNARLLARRDELLESGKHARNVTGILSREFNLESSTVRKILNEAPSR